MCTAEKGSVPRPFRQELFLTRGPPALATGRQRDDQTRARPEIGRVSRFLFSRAIFLKLFIGFSLSFADAAENEPPFGRNESAQGATSVSWLDVNESELACLTEAIYFEARGEGIFGQIAVAEVILNRRDAEEFPDTVCEVVHQGYDPVAPRLHACQFSYYCDGKSESIGNRDRFESIGALAWQMMKSSVRPLTGGATYYHADYVRPRWARKLQRVRRVESHVFYRNKYR